MDLNEFSDSIFKDISELKKIIDASTKIKDQIMDLGANSKKFRNFISSSAETIEEMMAIKYKDIKTLNISKEDIAEFLICFLATGIFSEQITLNELKPKQKKSDKLIKNIKMPITPIDSIFVKKSPESVTLILPEKKLMLDRDKLLKFLFYSDNKEKIELKCHEV